MLFDGLASLTLLTDSLRSRFRRTRFAHTVDRLASLVLLTFFFEHKQTSHVNAVLARRINSHSNGFYQLNCTMVHSSTRWPNYDATAVIGPGRYLRPLARTAKNSLYKTVHGFMETFLYGCMWTLFARVFNGLASLVLFGGLVSLVLLTDSLRPHC